MYIRLDHGIAKEIIPDIDPIFPDITIENRYPEKFLAECIYVPDDTNVTLGYYYDYAIKRFREPTASLVASMSQEMTDLQLELIEQGQFATELQLQLLEVMNNV